MAASGQDDGGEEDHGSAEPGDWAEGLVEDEDAEQGADERLHVEQDTGLRGRDLGHSPVPEERGGRGAEQAAGGEREPGLEGDVVHRRKAVKRRHDDEEHYGAGAEAVGGDDDGAVAPDEALVEQHPEEGDAEGEDHVEVAAQRGTVGFGVVRSAEGDGRGSDGGDDEGYPAEGVEALVGEDRGADGEDDRHGSDHERGVRDGGERETVELEEELERDSEDGGEKEGEPLAAVEAGTMREEEGRKTEGAEEEPVQDHRSGVHLGEGDLAEEKSTAPEHAGEAAGGEPEGAVACGVLVQRYPLPPSLFAQSLPTRDFKGGL